jgi:hypothetical protein
VRRRAWRGRAAIDSPLRRRRIGIGVALTLLAAPAPAHDGPPYALIVDAAFAGRTLTLYADPDVGVGTFYFYFEPPESASALPIRIGARPADGRLPEAFTAAEPAREKAPYQIIAEVPFDRRGAWSLRLLAEAPADAGDGNPPGASAASWTPRELRLDVDVTPPGSLGPVDILWFLSPFAAIAFLWIKAMRQRRRAASEVPPDPPTS